MANVSKSAYQEGLDDALCGRPIKLIRHPRLGHYLAGYGEGQKAAQPQQPRDMTFIERIVYVLFGYCDKRFQQNINLAAEYGRYHKALITISKARLEPGHIYQQALMLQEIAAKALEGK